MRSRSRRWGGRLKLRGGRPASDFVFTGPSGAPLGYTNFALAPKRAGINAGAPHSWRSIFSDWRGNVTEFPRELAEFQLAHVVPGAAGDYQREAAPDGGARSWTHTAAGFWTIAPASSRSRQSRARKVFWR